MKFDLELKAFESSRLGNNALRSLYGGKDLQTCHDTKGSDILHDDGRTRFSSNVGSTVCDTNCSLVPEIDNI